MEENPLPPGQTVPPSAATDSLDGAGTQVPVSSFAAAQKNYPVNETLEVHKEGARSQDATYTPTLRSVPFSRRKATLVSLFITLIVLVLTGASAIFLINRDVLEDQSQLKVPQQDVSVGEAGAALPELEGSGDALLVNGNIITRGELQVVSGDFTSSLRTDTLTGDQIFTLPNASGTVCLDANNCNFATQDQIATETAEINQQAAELAAQAADIAALQAQLAQIVIPPAGVTSLNGFAGGVTIQGTPNQIIVNAAGGTITLATPQDLAALSSPTFAGLTLNGSLNLTGTVTLPLDCTSFTNDGKLTTTASGQIICGNDVGGGGGGAPADAEYLVVSLNPGLSDERALQAGANIAFTDGGANGNFTVATVQNPTFTTSVTTPLLTSTGALAITPGGPLTIGATSQTTLLQGSTTTVTSSAGNNIVLNSGNTIELQDNTNITGNLNVTGTGNIDGITSIGNNASPIAIAPLSVGHDFNGTNCAAFGCYGVFSSLTATNVTGANAGVSGFFSNIEVTSGNLDGAVGFFAANPSGAGTVTNNYGVYVSNLTKGTNDYGIYVQGAETYGLWIDSGATRLDGTLEVQTLGGNDTDTVLCHNSANQVATCNSTFATTTDLNSYVQLQGVTPGTAQTGHINVTGTIIAGSFSGNGANLTSLNASALATGTVANARLVNGGALSVTAGAGLSGGGSVALGGSTSLDVLYGAVAGTAVQGNTAITCPSGTGNLTGGGDVITLGSGGTCSNLNTVANPTFATSVTTPSLILTGAGSNGTLEVASLGQATTYTLPDPGQATADICLSTGNCTGTGGGVTTAGGTTNTIALFTGSQSIGDSIITQSGSVIDIAGSLTLDTQLAVAEGGTGATSFTTNGVLYGNGTSAVQATVAPTAGQVLIGNGAGVPTFTTFSGDITVSGTGVTTLQPNSVALGTDTTGNYVANLGALTGLSTTGNTGEGSTPTLSVLYGSTANTSVQGNTTLTCASGTGNLTGGGNSVTLGGGGACSDLTIVDDPTFATSVTTPAVILTGLGSNGTLEVANLGQATTYTLPDPGQATADICLSTGNCAGAGGGVTTGGGTTNRIAKFTSGNNIEDSSISDDGSLVTVNGNVNLEVQGTNVTIGAGGTRTGSIVLHNSTNTNTVSLESGVTGTSYTLTLPTAVGAANQCLKAQDGTGALFWDDCLGGGGGSGITSVNGQAGPSITINNASGAGNAITIDDASTTQKGIAQFNATNFTAASGIINTIQDIHTGATPTFAGLTLNGTLNMGANDIQGTNFSVDGATGNVTSGLINGQTISSTANFTGTLSVATSVTTPQLILTGAGSNGTLEIANLGQATTYTLPDPGQATADICLSTGNCAGAGGGITGSGTNNTVAKFTGSGTIGDSSITDDGVTVGIGTNTNVTGTLGASGNINTSGGAIQTNSTTRIDNSGNLTNINNATVGGTLTANGNVSLGDAAADTVTVAGTIQGASPLVFEGGVVDANQLTLAVASLTGDQTITLPDETGTVCLQNSANCGFLLGSGEAFVQNGNDFGGTTAGTLGTINNGNLNFITNNVTRLTIDTSGDATLTGNLTVQGTGTSSFAGDLVVSSRAAIGGSAGLSDHSPLRVSETFDGTYNCETVGACYGTEILAIADNPAGVNIGTVGLRAGVGTAATAFTLDRAAAITAASPIIGAGSTIDTSYGLFVENMTGANNNYGIYVEGADTYALWVNSGLSRLDGNLEVRGDGTNPGEVNVGISGAQRGLLVLQDGSSGFHSIIRPDGLTGNHAVLLPDDSGTICLQASAACGFVTGSGTAFVQNGNDFGGTTPGTLGTINNGNLNFITNNVTRLTVSTSSVTSTLPILGQNGTAGAPAYSFSSDNNTGIYHADPTNGDQIGFSTGGANRVTIGADPSAMDYQTGVLRIATTNLDAGPFDFEIFGDGTQSLDIGGNSGITLQMNQINSDGSFGLWSGVNELLTIADDGNTVLGTSTAAGDSIDLIVGDASSDTPGDRVLFVDKQLDATTGTVNAPNYGINSTWFHGSVSAGATLAAPSLPEPVTNAISANNSWVEYDVASTGTISGMLQSYRSDLMLTGGGTVNSAAGFAVGTPHVTSTTLTDFYGVRIEAIGSEASNGYGIYQVGTADENYFGGTIQLESLGTGNTTELCLNASNIISDCSTSLAGYKDNIEGLSLGLDTINQLQARQFSWNEDGSADLGFVAEEVAAVDPLLAQYKDGELSGVKYRQMSALLVKGIQELDVKVSNNTSQITSVEAANESLNADVLNLATQSDTLSGQIAGLQTDQEDLQTQLAAIQNQINSGQFSSLNVSGPSTLSNLTVTGTATINNLVVTNATVTESLTVNGHIITGNSSGDTTAEVGAASCDGTVTIDGNDTAGTITIQTGGGTCTPGTLATVNFATTFDASPRVILSPANAGSAAVGYYTGATNITSFTIDVADAPTASTTYIYNYHVMQ